MDRLRRSSQQRAVELVQAKQEPHWHYGPVMRRGAVPDDAACWLFDSASLTRRLRRVSNCFRVELLSNQRERPMRCERQVLGMDDRALALVRQVRLYCDGEAKVYARTVMPLSSLTGRRRRLARLGGKPLGEMLFRDPTMSRGEMEVAQLSEGHRFYGLAVQGLNDVPETLWGRRSVFKISGYPLLVNEFFLPPLLTSEEFRIKRKV